jgi:hypothetical protein
MILLKENNNNQNIALILTFESIGNHQNDTASNHQASTYRPS